MEVLPQVDVVVARASHRPRHAIGRVAVVDAREARRVALDRRLDDDVGVVQVAPRARVGVVLDLDRQRRLDGLVALGDRHAVERAAFGDRRRLGRR